MGGYNLFELKDKIWCSLGTWGRISSMDNDFFRCMAAMHAC